MKKLSKEMSEVLDLMAARRQELLLKTCQTEKICGAHDPLTARYRNGWWEVRRLHDDILDKLGMS